MSLGQKPIKYKIHSINELSLCIVQRRMRLLFSSSTTQELTLLHSFTVFMFHPFHVNVQFYTPQKSQKTSGFLTFSGGIEMEDWCEMG